MDTPLATVAVQFVAEGIDKITEETESLREAVNKAFIKQQALDRLLSDPTYVKAARDVETLAAANRSKLSPAVVELTKLEKLRDSNASRSHALRGGEYLKEASLLAGLRRESDLIARAERRADLVGQQGRLLGGVIHATERGRPALMAAGSLGAMGLAAGRSGLGGTVEMNQFNMELHLINREIGNALLPALQWLTGGFRKLRHFLEQLTPGQQDLLGAGAIGLGGIGAAGMALSGIGHIANGLRGVGLIGGQSATGGLISGIAETAAGTAIGRGMSGAKIGTGGKIGVAAVALNAAKEMTDNESFYRLNREAGHNQFKSAYRGFLQSGYEMVGLDKLMTDAFGSKSVRDIMRGEKIRDMQDAGHRNSAIADAGFEDFDSTYTRLSTATALQGATQDAPNKVELSDVQVASIMEQLRRMIERNNSSLPR